MPESRTKTRTRAAILTAAASLLARDRSATLAQIAEATEVGRSSLHRYFPDREILLHAVVEDSVRRLDRSIREAALGEGHPRLQAGRVDRRQGLARRDRVADLDADSGHLARLSELEVRLVGRLDGAGRRHRLLDRLGARGDELRRCRLGGARARPVQVEPGPGRRGDHDEDRDDHDDRPPAPVPAW